MQNRRVSALIATEQTPSADGAGGCHCGRRVDADPQQRDSGGIHLPDFSNFWVFFLLLKSAYAVVNGGS